MAFRMIGVAHHAVTPQRRRWHDPFSSPRPLHGPRLPSGRGNNGLFHSSGCCRCSPCALAAKRTPALASLPASPFCLDCFSWLIVLVVVMITEDRLTFFAIVTEAVRLSPEPSQLYPRKVPG